MSSLQLFGVLNKYIQYFMVKRATVGNTIFLCLLPSAKYNEIKLHCDVVCGKIMFIWEYFTFKNFIAKFYIESIRALTTSRSRERDLYLGLGTCHN